MDVQDIQIVIVHGREIWEEDLYIPLVLVSVSYREIRWKTIFTWEETGKLLFTWSELCELASEKQEKVLYKKALCSYFELCQIGVREALSLEEMKNLSDTPENIFIEILFGDPKQKDITHSVYSSSEEIRNDLMSLSIEPDKVYRAKYPYSQPIPYRRKSRNEYWTIYSSSLGQYLVKIMNSNDVLFLCINSDPNEAKLYSSEKRAEATLLQYQNDLPAEDGWHVVHHDRTKKVQAT